MHMAYRQQLWKDLHACNGLHHCSCDLLQLCLCLLLLGLLLLLFCRLRLLRSHARWLMLLAACDRADVHPAVRAVQTVRLAPVVELATSAGDALLTQSACRAVLGVSFGVFRRLRRHLALACVRPFVPERAVARNTAKICCAAIPVQWVSVVPVCNQDSVLDRKSVV